MPTGTFNDQALAVASRAVRTFPVPSALCLVLRVEAEVNQRVMPLAGLHHHVAAVSAIAAGWATPRHKLLPAEGHAAIAAIASLHPDPCFINKHSRLISLSECTKAAPSSSWLAWTFATFT